MADEHFWGTDMTTVHERRSWFGELSSHRKLLFCLLLLFVVSWCFLVGFALAGEMNEEEWYVANSEGDNAYMAEQLQLTGTRSILIIGCDNRGEHQVSLTDTIMVAFLNMDDKEVQILSIPRDSYVQIPGTSTKTKINAAYNYGGISLCQSTVEYLLGIEIDNYIIVDFEGFKQVVDTIGGVEIHVDTRMEKYEEGINLNPGWQTLMGDDALAFVRYRDYVDGDISRIQHQQGFIRALATELMKVSTVLKIPQLVKIGISNVVTDLSMADALSLGNYFATMDLDNMHMRTVPGTPMWLPYGGAWFSYLIVNHQELVTLLENMIGGDFQFSPNVISDEGQGRYSPPEDTQQPTEGEELPLPLENDPDATDTPAEPVDPTQPAQPTEPTEPIQPTDPGDNNGGMIDLDDIPEPGE